MEDVSNCEQLCNLHIQDLAKIREVIVLVIRSLEDEIINPVLNKQDNYQVLNNFKLILGKNEDVTTTLIKLTNLLIKIIPLEQKLINQESLIKGDNSSPRIISQEDMAIIKRYLHKKLHNLPLDDENPSSLLV